jgi:hypothetical protein
MSLRRRPTVTPAGLAANRANARRSTGPRTVEGKNRVVLNALKEGRHARNLGENLRRAKSQEDAELFQWILDQVGAAFRLHGWPEDERKAERFAQRVWCELEREERRLYGLYAFARRLGIVRVSPTDCDGQAQGPAPTALDAAAVGRGGNKPGICREINR